MIEERFTLAKDRIKEIKEEQRVEEPFLKFFKEAASFLMSVCELADANKEKDLKTYVTKELPARTIEELLSHNHKYYRELEEENYKNSFLNPKYAVTMFSENYGRLLSFLYAELHSVIPYAYEVMYKKEQSLFQIVIRAELFIEIYVCFVNAFEDLGKVPEYEELKEIIYWFISDYTQPLMEERVKEKVEPTECFAFEIIKNADLCKPNYLFAFGEYIGDNQIKTARYLAEQSDDKISLMADTYTEGYRIGFVKGNKDLSKKKVVNIVYPLGFERMILKAIHNFDNMGLKPTIMRSSRSIFHKRGMAIGGYYSDSPNRQSEFDHKEDEALFLDKKLVHRKLEIAKESYELNKEWSGVHAGPAWVEIFGEKKFEPVMKAEACRLSKKQQELSTTYYGQLGQIINEYMKGEERSFTIIAFPVPEIGSRYEEIMDRTIELNTLDYKRYEDMQQKMIDVLDTTEYVRIKGKNGNETDLKVALCKLDNQKEQTKFENCVADVNIPVGEIFTSPVLKGTEGLLHVSSVFLNGLEYKDLKIRLKDGMVSSYSCRNFEEEEKNLSYIKENILFHHDTLPIGEFAIGTNTTAYAMGREYEISDKLPILIAEKTGPHFAFGDTCYSHAEDVKVYNADGKEIIARDNEISVLRKTDMDKAYFQCHTDITIPYDEIGELTGVCENGDEKAIIVSGRFVLSGCEELNKPLEND